METSHSAFFSEQNNTTYIFVPFPACFLDLQPFFRIYSNLLSNAISKNHHRIPDDTILEEGNKWDSMSCQNLTSLLELLKISFNSCHLSWWCVSEGKTLVNENNKVFLHWILRAIMPTCFCSFLTVGKICWTCYWNLKVPSILHRLQSLYCSAILNTIKVLEIFSFHNRLTISNSESICWV